MATALKPSLARLLLFALVPCFLLFGTLELIARLRERTGRPQPITELAQGFSAMSRVFVPHPSKPNTMVTNPSRAHVFVAQEFAQPKPAHTVRIAALGESSVYYLQNDFARIAARLSSNQSFEILNAGGQSYGSERLSLVALELLEYSPDLLFVYMGHNEFEEAEQMALIHPELSGPVQIAFDHSSLIRLAVRLLTEANVEKLKAEHKKRLLSDEPDVARAWKVEFSEQDVQSRMRNFRANLQGIIELYRSRNIPVILSTVPSNLVRPYLPRESIPEFFTSFKAYKLARFSEAKEIARKVLREARGRHQSSDLENTILRDLARQYRLPLLDVEAIITESEPHKIPGETLFADHCHLSSAGNQLLANGLERLLANPGILPRY
jgi:lysophospholipase L1-like esterase